MPVDKFGNSGGDENISTTNVSTSIGLTLSQIVNVFLRRDGGNNAIGHLDMNNHKIVNVDDPIALGDAVNKKYVDQNTVSSAGDVINGNLIFKIGNNPSLSLGCNDLRGNKRFLILLGNVYNLLYFVVNQPLTIQSSHGVLCRVGDSDVAKFDSAIIKYLKDVDMSGKRITNLKDPEEVSDAVTKGYLDEILAKPKGTNLDLNRKKVINMLDPSSGSDAATKGYVDRSISARITNEELGWAIQNINNETRELNIKLSGPAGETIKLLIYFRVSERLYKSTHIVSSSTAPFSSPETEFLELRVESSSRHMWIDPFSSTSTSINVGLTGYNRERVNITNWTVKVFRSLA